MDQKKHWARLLLGSILAAALLTGCAGETGGGPTAPESPPPEGGYSLTGESPAPDPPGEEGGTTAGESLLDADGTYSSMEDVALYLHTYGELPDNFITKNEAQDLGWTGGSVERYAPGMCIGGDTFGNREGLLPQGNYHECDINTLGAESRGAERIVWDTQGNIYYTDDHYESFELVYAGDAE